MRRPALVLTTLLLSSVGLVIAPPASAQDEQPGFDSAHVTIELKRDGTAYAHPGFRVAEGEAGVFVIECADKQHEITVTLAAIGDAKAELELGYTIDGQVKLETRLTVELGQPTRVKAGASELVVVVDPHGRADRSRGDGDKIEGPGSDDPLG